MSLTKFRRTVGRSKIYLLAGHEGPLLISSNINYIETVEPYVSISFHVYLILLLYIKYIFIHNLLIQVVKSVRNIGRAHREIRLPILHAFEIIWVHGLKYSFSSWTELWSSNDHRCRATDVQKLALYTATVVYYV